MNGTDGAVDGGDAGIADPDVPCENPPVIISTVEELQAMANQVDGSHTHNYIDGHYALGNDIDASDTKNWNGGAGFQPIGTLSGPFTGCLDGRGFTIKGLHIDRRETEGVGLFGSTVRSDIRNLVLEDFSIRGNNSTGGLVGETSETDITNVHASGTNEPALKSCWDAEASGQSDSDAGQSHTTAEMQEQATFEDWDFHTIWTIDAGRDYPDLQGAPR